MPINTRQATSPPNERVSPWQIVIMPRKVVNILIRGVANLVRYEPHATVKEAIQVEGLNLTSIRLQGTSQVI